MIAVDTNILVFAHRQDSPWHHKALRTMTDLAEGQIQWGLLWPCLHEFYGVVTHPRLYRPASTIAEAITQIEQWMLSPSVVLLAEGQGHWPELRRMLIGSQITGPLIHDARIAALCQTHGVLEFWTADRDFSRFPDLPVRNPLVG